MNVLTVLNKVESLPEELKEIEKKINHFTKIKENFSKQKKQLNDKDLNLFLDNITKEIKALENRKNYIVDELNFYQRRKKIIDYYFADINYDKELYIEKKFKDYSLAKIGIRHNNITPQTIYKIIKNVEKELQKMIDEDLYQEWLEKQLLYNN